MGFEEVSEKQAKRRVGPPRLNISPTGDNQTAGYLNAAAVREWWSERNATIYHVDRDYSRLGLEPAGENRENAYKLNKKGGATIHADPFLAQFGIGAVGEKAAVDLQKDDETGFIIADLPELVEAETGAVHCPECGKRCADEQGLKTHQATHDDPKKSLEDMDPDEVGEAFPDAPEA